MNADDKFKGLINMESEDYDDRNVAEIAFNSIENK
jgi:hypothetical protein